MGEGRNGVGGRDGGRVGEWRFSITFQRIWDSNTELLFISILPLKPKIIETYATSTHRIKTTYQPCKNRCIKVSLPSVQPG